MNAIFPPRLKPGDVISLIAPAGAVDPKRLRVAIERLESEGFRTKTYRNIYERFRTFAGDDTARIVECQAAFDDPETSAVFAARGGYGCVRIVDRLDFDRVRQRPKIFVGFSDNTVLHAALWQRTRMVSFHGPHPSDSFGRPEGIHPFTQTWLWRWTSATEVELTGACSAEEWMELSEIDLPAPARLRTLVPGQARGRLCGGNLALVASLLGTPFQLDTANCILFLEDVGERPYRIDRYLQQMRLAGSFADVAGVLLGFFSNCDGPQPDDTCWATLTEFFADAPFPVLAGIPAGHEAINMTMPLGADCQMDANRKIIRFRSKSAGVCDRETL